MRMCCNLHTSVQHTDQAVPILEFCRSFFISIISGENFKYLAFVDLEIILEVSGREIFNSIFDLI